MLGKFVMTIVIPGTLAAPVDFMATMPSACTIQHVSMVQSNAGAGRVKFGTTSDDDAYLAYTTLGISDTPVELSALTDWIDDTRPHLDDGDVLAIYLDHDGDGGTAADDVTIVITFTEG